MDGVQIPDVLPQPDDYGNYYLSDDVTGPGIFRATSPKAPEGHYYASLGHEGHVLFDGPALCYFGTPLAALHALQREARREGGG